MAQATAIRPTSNGAKEEIAYQEPYEVKVTIRGVAPILFHAWNNEAVEQKAKAAKNSKSKKTDNLESYVYRTANQTLGIPGTSFHACLRETARFRQDPRSPRKSAMDLVKAGIIPITVVADTGAKMWDFISRERVVVQRNAITRERPALREGWTATFELLVTVPEYISPAWLHDLATMAGKLQGICDHRPTYGRFQIDEFRTSPLVP